MAKRIFVPISDPYEKRLKKLAKDDKRSVAFKASEALEVGIPILEDRKHLH